MSNRKNIVLTFDYELFLGSRSGSAEKCIIQPTSELMKVMNRYNAKGVFFVDILCLMNYEKHPGFKADLDKIKVQIKELYDSGNYIFPHLHPHWLDAVLNEDIFQYNLSNFTKYSLAVLPPEKIESLFLESINYLRSIGVEYKEWGYRAGGYCIQPFDLFKEVFKQSKIKYDFSVLPGYVSNNGDQYFDYSSVGSKLPYRFGNDIEKQEMGGLFIEYPISVVNIKKYIQLRERIRNKYLWTTGDKSYGDGISAVTAAFIKNIDNNEMISIDILTLPKLKTYLNFLEENDYMQWISHPKLLRKHSLKVFEKFLKEISKKYEVNYDFKRIKINEN